MCLELWQDHNSSPLPISPIRLPERVYTYLVPSPPYPNLMSVGDAVSVVSQTTSVERRDVGNLTN